MGTNQEANFTDRVKGPDKEWKSKPSRVVTKLGRVGLFYLSNFGVTEKCWKGLKIN